MFTHKPGEAVIPLSDKGAHGSVRVCDRSGTDPTIHGSLFLEPESNQEKRRTEPLGSDSVPRFSGRVGFSVLSKINIV